MSATELQVLLEELAGKHKVPGATAAVLDGDEVTEAATGVINKNTGVKVTTDTLFQLGSITKVYTATLVMQLVDEGKADLDVPVRKYVPELKLADREATDSITVRQLLCHASGLPDHAEDTGRGDDCTRKLVAAYVTLPQISAPGRMFSYSNPGFAILGRMVENLTEQIWDAALKTRLLDPLGTKRTVTLPEDAILHRAAVGHMDPTNSGDASPTPVWGWPRSFGSHGGIISTAAELLCFARLHLDDGVASDGTRVLSRSAVREMQQPQIECVDSWFADTWGLGWALLDWGGHRVIWHDGGGKGQVAFLRIVPEARFAAALLTNGWRGKSLAEDFFKPVITGATGIEAPTIPEARQGVAFDTSAYTGTYERLGVRTQVETLNGGLVAKVEWGGIVSEMIPTIGGPLKPIDDHKFLFHWPQSGVDSTFVFSHFDELGRPGYLHWGGRASPRLTQEVNRPGF